MSTSFALEKFTYVVQLQGDSGGPLMLDINGNWVQIGIVSFGNR